MTIIIELTPQEEAWVRDQSAKSGLHPSEIVKQLVDDRLPSLDSSRQPVSTTPASNAENDATIALIDSWLQEDATDDPEEIRKAEADLLEFKRNMNAPRKENGERLLFPEVE